MAVGKGKDDGGVIAGGLLAAYAEAVHHDEGVVDALVAVADRLGPEAAQEAAMTCAAFNGLVRVADGIGIQLDEGTEASTRSARVELGLDQFGGANNTEVPSGPDVEAKSVLAMFSSES